MALLRLIGHWLGSPRADRPSEAKRRRFRPALEGMEDRLLPSASPLLSGQWFVQSDGLAANIVPNGTQLLLTNEYGQQTTGQWLGPTTFRAWGQTATVVQTASFTQILWNGNAWTQSAWQEGGLSGQWFVQSNGGAASITQSGSQLLLTNEQGQQTTGQWLSPTTFAAWGQTAQVIKDGPVTQILWNGNVWTRSSWQNGGLAGQWFVQSNGGAASITQNGTQILLTNEQGQQTTGQWLSPTAFQAWGQTATIVQDGPVTQILWNGNAWTRSSWQNGGLAGQWFVQSNGGAASITQNGSQLLLTNEQGQQTTGQWLSPTTFRAWGQTATVVQNGPATEIVWNGSTWSQSAWQEGGLSGQWFVQSNGQAASITQSGSQLLLTNEQGQETVGQWLSPTTFAAWGQTATIMQNGPITQILWNGDVWTQSSWQNGGLAGQWFVQSNGLAASITQSGSQLLLTNEQGQQTTGQWLSPTTFEAWGQTASVSASGGQTTIQWNGNAWTQSAWQDGGLAGQWFVQSNGLPAYVVQYGTQLVVTNEQGQQALGEWLSPTTFAAWGQTASVSASGGQTTIQWSGNAWTQSAWQDGSLAGQWQVQSNGRAASIAQNGTQLLLTNENGAQTTGQWLSPTTFQAWGQTATIVQNGPQTTIQWNGNAWSRTAPSITSAGGATFLVGQTATFTVTTQGFPAAAITESGALPKGVSFVSNGNGTATLSGTPVASSASLVPYTFTITAGNYLGTATQTFSLTVDRPPVFTSATSTTFTVGQAGSFSVTTTPGLPATATLSERGNLPAGVTFTPGNNGTATLHGTPAAGSAGSYTILLVAGNAVGSQATEAFTLNVSGAPTITSTAHATFVAGQPGRFTILTKGSPTAALTLNGALPAGVTFTDNGNGTATLAGTPAAGSGGTYGLTVGAANGLGSVAQQFALAVAQPPAITSAAATTFTVGQAGSFTVTTTPGLPKITTLGETGKLPAGVTFTANGNGTATLKGKPAAGTGGTYAITLIAGNAAGSQTTQTFVLTVAQPPAITSASRVAFALNQSDAFTITTTGFPAATVTERGALPGGVTLVSKGNGTAVLSGKPTAKGTFVITIVASDGALPGATQTFDLTVA